MIAKSTKSRRPPKRTPTGYALRDWSNAKQEKFLATLADTANVTASAKAVNFKEAAVYDFRRKSAAFRAAWHDALCEGYAKLELMMLERAMAALRPETGDASIDLARTKVEEYSNKLAIGLLAAHRATVRGERASLPKVAYNAAETRAQVVERLTDMRERMKAAGHVLPTTQ